MIVIKKDFSDKKSWTPLLRQTLICSGIWSTFFVSGLIQGSPTVFIPQLRRAANSTDAVTVPMAAWLSSASGYAALIFLPVLTLSSYLFGRRRCFLFISIIILSNFIYFYHCTTPNQLLLAMIFFGALNSYQTSIGSITVSEYTSPKFRGTFASLKIASISWGVWVSNAIGTFFPWKYIAIVGIICMSYNLVSYYFWCESPYWLASKYKFDDCAKSLRWLKGTGDDAEKELVRIIEEKQKTLKDSNKTIVDELKNFIQVAKTKEYYKSILIILASVSLFHVSGKFVSSVYAIDIIKNITDSESTAYVGMLIMDGVTVLGMYGGCILMKYLNRRTILLSSFSFIICLYILSLYLFLISLNVISENVYVSLCLLMAYSFTLSSLLSVLLGSILSEMIPLKYTNTAMLIISEYLHTVAASMLYFAPFLFETLKMYGTFLFYAVLASIFWSLLVIFLPETRNKTLNEIADCVSGVKPVSSNKVVC